MRRLGRLCRLVRGRLAAAGRATADTWRDAERTELRMERLEERMAREPDLERELDARIPERQLQVAEPGMSRGKDRGFNMSS